MQRDGENGVGCGLRKVFLGVVSGGVVCWCRLEKKEKSTATTQRERKRRG